MYAGGDADAERLARGCIEVGLPCSCKCWLVQVQAAPHVATADSACLAGPRLQFEVGPAAGDVSTPAPQAGTRYLGDASGPRQPRTSMQAAPSRWCCRCRVGLDTDHNTHSLALSLVLQHMGVRFTVAMPSMPLHH